MDKKELISPSGVAARSQYYVYTKSMQERNSNNNNNSKQYVCIYRYIRANCCSRTIKIPGSVRVARCLRRVAKRNNNESTSKSRRRRRRRCGGGKASNSVD